MAAIREASKLVTGAGFFWLSSSILAVITRTSLGVDLPKRPIFSLSLGFMLPAPAVQFLCIDTEIQNALSSGHLDHTWRASGQGDRAGPAGDKALEGEPIAAGERQQQGRHPAWPEFHSPLPELGEKQALPGLQSFRLERPGEDKAARRRLRGDDPDLRARDRKSVV